MGVGEVGRVSLRLLSFFSLLQNTSKDYELSSIDTILDVTDTVQFPAFNSTYSTATSHSPPFPFRSPPSALLPPLSSPLLPSPLLPPSTLLLSTLYFSLSPFHRFSFPIATVEVKRTFPKMFFFTSTVSHFCLPQNATFLYVRLKTLQFRTPSSGPLVS